ncbi:MAG: hypothetical protein L0229_05470 [Blastocatellia bacterium]|nr:hypothetical protein [Blastocatellia bacterium]
MVFNRSLFKMSTVIAAAVFAMAGIFISNGLGQDPTGRPKETREPRNRRPVKRPPVKVEPPAPTVILTILTDPPECTVYINGDARGVTDSEGKAQFEKVPIASYLVEVRKDGFKHKARSFRAGEESPTLVFKLEASLDSIIEEFNSLLTAGKIAGPESPNAFELLTRVASEYPDRPEVERMRGVLMPTLTEPVEPAIEKTILYWRSVERNEIAFALGRAAKAVTLKSDDRRLQAKLSYLRGVQALRDWMIAGAQPGGEQEGTNSKGDLTAARQELENALNFDQFFAPAQYQLGVALLNSNDFAGAETVFRTVVQLEPRWPFSHTGLASALYGQGKYKESVEANSKAIEIDANFSAAYAGRGIARSMLKDKNAVKDAIKDIERAKQLDPSSGLPHLNMGIVLSKSKKSKERDQAVEELKQAIKKNSLNLEFQNSLAEQMLGDLQKNKRK